MKTMLKEVKEMGVEQLRAKLMMLEKELQELKSQLVPTYFKTEEELNKFLEQVDTKQLEQEIKQLEEELKKEGIL